MSRISKIVICAFLAILSINGFSQTNEKKIFVAIDGLAPALKFGIEKNTSERLSLKASVGFCIVGPSLLSYNLYCSYKITKPENAFGFNLNFGLLDNYIDIATPMFSLGFGGSAGIYYRFQNNSALIFRLGMITGPSIDNREFAMLTLPNFGFEYAFIVNKNSKKNK